MSLMHQYYVVEKRICLTSTGSSTQLVLKCSLCKMELVCFEGGSFDDSYCPGQLYDVFVEEVNPANHPFIDF